MKTYTDYIVKLANDDMGQVYLKDILLNKLFEEKNQNMIEYLKFMVLVAEGIPQSFKDSFIKKCIDLKNILNKEEKENNDKL